MSVRTRLAMYLLVAVALVVLLMASPRAWAVPDPARPGQTVPTLTPSGARPTAPEPDNSPVPPTPPPTGTPAPVPTVAVASSATAAPEAALALAKEAAPEQVWPGVTVHYTLTLSNRGAASARQVILSDTLPEGLEPGQVVSGPGPRWDGRTLRAIAPVLPPGGQLVVAFTALVRDDVAPGGVLVNQAIASAADGLNAVASLAIVLPPAELPPTGRRSHALRDGSPCSR